VNSQRNKPTLLLAFAFAERRTERLDQLHNHPYHHIHELPPSLDPTLLKLLRLSVGSHPTKYEKLGTVRWLRPQTECRP